MYPSVSLSGTCFSRLPIRTGFFEEHPIFNRQYTKIKTIFCRKLVLCQLQSYLHDIVFFCDDSSDFSVNRPLLYIILFYDNF